MRLLSMLPDPVTAATAGLRPPPARPGSSSHRPSPPSSARPPLPRERRGAPHLHRGHLVEAELPQGPQHARAQRHRQRAPAALSHRLHLGPAVSPPRRSPAPGPPRPRSAETRTAAPPVPGHISSATPRPVSQTLDLATNSYFYGELPIVVSTSASLRAALCHPSNHKLRCRVRVT